VINPTLRANTLANNAAAFWLRIVNDDTLLDCNDLEKLLAGCEVIAAVDDLDLLAA
jgi:hypothetical protein